ncbi:hypothetical protein JXQ31_11950 [candidate division KSB1 bacterium]|nr:hypothetical protein [candidate division KSB1 bacterium]
MARKKMENKKINSINEYKKIYFPNYYKQEIISGESQSESIGVNLADQFIENLKKKIRS